MSSRAVLCVDGLPDRGSSSIDIPASFELCGTVACVVGYLRYLLNIACEVSQDRFGVRFRLFVDMLVGMARGVARLCLARL